MDRIALGTIGNTINIVLNSTQPKTKPKPKPQTTHELSEMQKIERVEDQSSVNIEQMNININVRDATTRISSHSGKLMTQHITDKIKVHFDNQL